MLIEDEQRFKLVHYGVKHMIKKCEHKDGWLIKCIGADGDILLDEETYVTVYCNSLGCKCERKMLIIATEVC